MGVPKHCPTTEKRPEAICRQAGDIIVGLSSSGQASYESAYNSGIGSNGLTAARHEAFHYALAAEYPESFDPLIDQSLVLAASSKEVLMATEEDAL